MRPFLPRPDPSATERQPGAGSCPRRRVIAALRVLACLFLVAQFALASVAAHRYRPDQGAQQASLRSASVGAPADAFCARHAPDHTGLRPRCNHCALCHLAAADLVVASFTDDRPRSTIAQRERARDGPPPDPARTGSSSPRGPPDLI